MISMAISAIELELIQSRMAQTPVLRGEVGCACVARGVSDERGGMGERGCARRLGGWVWVWSRLGRVCVCGVRGHFRHPTSPTRLLFQFHFTPQHWLRCHMGLH